MKLEQIEQVIEISKTGSIGKAARNLYMSQPNLSVSIKALEDEIGVTLFNRSKKGMQLTNFGKDFLLYAETIFEHYNILKELCSTATNSQISMSLYISTMHLKFVNNTFIDLYNKYKKHDPHFSLKELSFTQVVKNVSDYTSDVGIIFQSNLQLNINKHIFNQNNLVYTKLCDGIPVVLIGRMNPFFSEDIDEISIEMISNYTFICYESILNSFSNEISLLGLREPLNRIIVNDRATYNELISQTDGFAVAFWSKNPYRNTKYYDNIRAIPLYSPDFVYEIGWVSRKGIPPSKIALEFLQLLDKVLNN